ncbi:Cysteine protease atg4b [Mortierella sp. AM989]|nr:Cysteine protease atg4b [Mortierella sp. AM989]
MGSPTLPIDPTGSPSRNPPRPIYNRSRSQHGMSSFNSSATDHVALSEEEVLRVSTLSLARSYEDMYAGTTAASSRATTSAMAAGKGTVKGTGTGTGSSKQAGAIDRKHFSSTVSNASRKKSSHSRGDIEFWASLYAQHKVYTRQALKTTDESVDSSFPSASSPLSSGVPSAVETNHYNNNHENSIRAPIKIWQVLTKTELEHHPDKHIRRKTKSDSYETFQFERLPIKAPNSSTATATALSSNGRPFSIVFFFTIETLVSPATKTKERFRSRSRSKSKIPQEAATTLWYLETAYTGLRTLHEHMELMGDFMPNGSNPTDGGEVTPIYIYETQKMNFEQPRDQDEAVVLDLKLQSPEGSLYAEFSYTFVKDMKPEDVYIDSIRKADTTRKSKHNFGRNGRSKMAQTVFSRSAPDSPSRNSAEHELDSDEDYLVEKPGAREPALDVVAEEPDAGEHFMQATSQFFSKMGYWLYNSKVVQYIARDDRIRTKTAFPADDVWMLGVCYQFVQEHPVEEKVLVVASDADIKSKTKVADVPLNSSPSGLDPAPAASLKPSPAMISNSTPAETPDLVPTPIPNPAPAVIKDLAPPSASASRATSPSNSPKMDQASPERSKYSRKMSLSHFAANPPQRSAPTSSVSVQEAQSHSHSRSASSNITSVLLEDEFNIKSASSPARTRTLSHPAETASKSSSTTSGGSSKSTMAVMTTKLSNMSVNSKTSQSISNDGASQRDIMPVGGMVSAVGHENVQIQEQSTLPVRKPGRRRMTISELFSWDSNSSSTGNKHNGIGSNGNSNSVSALKSLVGSGKTSTASTVQPGEPGVKQKKSLVLAETSRSGVNDIRPTQSSTPSMVLPSSGTAPLTQLPVENQALPGSQGELKSDPSHSLVTNQTASDLEPISAATIPRQRERKRKTSNVLASSSNQVVSNRKDPDIPTSPSSDSSRLPAFEEGIILKPTSSSSQSIGRDYIPKMSSPSPLPSPLRSSFLAKRQNSMPGSPTNSRTHKHIEGAALSSLSPPPSPSSLPSPSSPGSSIKRSWRSLSLSIASTAKSAIPGLSSPVRSRSSLAVDNQQQKQYTHNSGFGHEYDGDDYDYYNQDNNANNSSLISLAPAVITAMSLQRPPPAWAAAAFKSLSPEQAVLRQFLMDFQSRLWFTYRKDLARIEPSFYTCDSGWGCMMRTGQSLLAQAFVQVLLGREWRAHLPQTQYDERRYGEILSWFVDEPNRPYSIHRIAKAGVALDKRIGEWFGPSTVAHAIKRLSQHHADCPLAILVPMDNNIRISNIVQAATASQTQAQTQTQTAPPKTITSWRPVLLLIPTRFGLEKLTERYIPNLKQLFRMPQFMGIAGGRPGRSLYFVACQGEELYYYDPHFVKPRVTSEELDSCPAPSFHCPVVRSMDIIELDPSMLLGFLIQSPSDLQDLLKRLSGPEMNQRYPLLAIQRDYDLEQGISGNDNSSNKDTIPASNHVVDQPGEAQVLSSSPEKFAQNNQQHDLVNNVEVPEMDIEDTFSIQSLDSEEDENDLAAGGGDEEEKEEDDDGVLV